MRRQLGGATDPHPEAGLGVAMGMTVASPLALLLLLLAAAAGEPKPSVPSVLLFLADDLGWANVDWHAPRGAAFHATPRLDALRRAGVELDHLYTYKYCSPSRSSMLTGPSPTKCSMRLPQSRIARCSVRDCSPSSDGHALPVMVGALKLPCT